MNSGESAWVAEIVYNRILFFMFDSIGQQYYKCDFLLQNSSLLGIISVAWAVISVGIKCQAGHKCMLWAIFADISFFRWDTFRNVAVFFVE